MAVLPAAKAYPRGGAPRRSYVKGAPLFARFLVKFNGVEYPRGSELPVADMSPAKHYELWVCGKADHLAKGPFDRKVKAADIVVTPEPVVDEKFDASDETLDATAPDVVDEHVDAGNPSDETPSQRKKKAKK